MTVNTSVLDNCSDVFEWGLKDVGQSHAFLSHPSGQIPCVTWHLRVIFEMTPGDQLDRLLGLDRRNGIAAVQQSARHVLAMTRVALHRHVGGFEQGVGDLRDGQLLVVRLLGADHRRMRADREVDTRLGHQVGLELGEVDVQGTIEPQRSSQRRDDLEDETVQVRVGR
jgi:hypothetical protein